MPGTEDGPEPTARAAGGDEVLLERRGPALWLRLNRPRALNSLTPSVIEGLDGGLDLAEGDPAIRAVVIAGAGRAFCAGADLTQVRARSNHGPEADTTSGPEPIPSGPNPELAFLRRVGAVFDRIEAFTKPVIAAVHGLAVAGGLELVLCADLVVAARSASFGDAHANYGLLPGAGGSVRLPRRIGPSRAKHLMFTGVSVPADRLTDTDLITELVEDEQLTSTVDTLTAAIAATSPLGVAAMKQLVADTADAPAAVGLRMEQHRVAAHTHSHDYIEGLAAFTDKRAPRFVGR